MSAVKSIAWDFGRGAQSAVVMPASDYDALLAERDALQQQVESLQNKWASRPLSVEDTAALEAENEALRAVLADVYDATTSNPKRWSLAHVQDATRPYARSAEVGGERK